MSQQQQQNILPLINADLRGFTVDCFGRCYPVTTHAKWPFFALRANKKRATYRPNFTQRAEYRIIEKWRKMLKFAFSMKVIRNPFLPHSGVLGGASLWHNIVSI